MEYRVVERNYKKISMIVVGILLLHALILLYLKHPIEFVQFLPQLLAPEQTTPEQKIADSSERQAENSGQEEQNESNLWSDMNQGGSKFGAPVIFQDDPDSMSDKDSSSEVLEKADAGSIIEGEDSVVVPNDDAQEIKTLEDLTQAVIEPEQKSEPEPKPAPVTPAPLQEERLIPTIDPVRAAPIEEKQIVPVTIVEEEKPVTQPVTKTITKKVTRKRRPVRQKNAAQVPLTLAGLTQGFLERQDHGGSDGITMKGNGGRVPSAQQIIFARYQQKINWSVQQAFHANKHRFYLNRPVNPSIVVNIKIGPTGVAEKIGLAQGSGVPTLDNFVIMVFEHAGKMFPAFPSGLPGQFKDMNYSIQCDIPAGKGSDFNWTMN